MTLFFLVLLGYQRKRKHYAAAKNQTAEVEKTMNWRGSDRSKIETKAEMSVLRKLMPTAYLQVLQEWQKEKERKEIMKLKKSACHQKTNQQEKERNLKRAKSRSCEMKHLTEGEFVREKMLISHSMFSRFHAECF